MRKQTHWQAMLLPLLLALLLLQPSHAMVLTEVVLSGTQSGEQQTIAAGWKAAAASLNKNSNANIQSNTISVASDSTTIGKSIASAATNALAVFGLYDDDMTLALSTDADFTSSNLVLFGPFTGSGGVRVWSENVYFMSADPMTELVTLLSWALSASAAGAVKFGKVGWMYLTGTAYNGELTTIITKELTNLGFSTPTTYEYPTTSTFTTANFDAFMATNPTCMFLFGARGAHTTAFFTALIQNTFVKTASNGFYIMMPFELMYSTGIAYQSQNAANVVSYNNLRYSAPLPVPTNTSFAASSSFQSDMKAFDASYTSLGTTTGYLMYYGWVYMQQIYYIGNTYNLGGGTNRAAIKKNIFMQNRYNIQDIVLGNYGGVCPSSGKASQLGAACKCNQGGHFITILKVTGTAGQNMGLNVAKDWDSIYPNTPCYPFTAAGSSTTSNIVVNYRNVQSAIVSIQDSTVATGIASQMSTGFSSGADGSTYGSTSPFTLSYTTLSATSSTTAAAAVTAAATVSVLSGPVTAPYTPSAMSNYLFVEPITVPLSLTTSTSSNAVYISATAAQQIYTAANFLSTKSKAGSLTGGVHLRYRTDESDLLNQMVGQSLGYYNIPLASTRGVGSTVLISSEIPTSGYTFVVGLQQADLAPLMAFLTAHPQAYIILNFDELTLTYDTITSVFGLSTAEPFMNQVLFATNIPSWTQTGTGSVFEKFVGKLSAAQRTPAAMRAFVAARAVCIANNQTQSSTPQQVLKQWYDATVITVDSLVLGPYIGSAVVFPPSASSNSATNYGARSIAMWSYTRIITPTTNYVADPVTLPLLYATTITTTTTIPEVTSTTETPAKPAATTTSTTTTTTTLSPCSVTTSTTTLPPPKSTTTTTTTSAPSTKSSKSDAWKYVVVAILAGLLIAVVLYAIHLCCTVLPCFGGESFQSAPVDSDAATTVVFVEVEKWSDVQRAVPDAATECTGKYRNLVRRLANKFDCYETGSLNDAFMLVARNPINALKFASALQKEVDGMHGSSVDAVDAAYSSLGFSSGAVRGMRVRVGVHTDVVDIAYDVDTDHYEYRGSGCVAALRTERLAHGGQVLVTGATCEALTEKQLAGVNAVSVGTQSFEEYDEPVPLFEVVGGVHREFGGVQSRPSPLCVGDPALSMCTESAVLCDEDLAEIALTREILSIAFSPLPVKKRITVLRGECQVRGIRVPQRQPRLLDESYAAVLLDLLVQYTFMNSAKTSVPYSGAGMMDADHKGKKIQASTATGTSQSSAVDETGEGTSIDKLREGDADSSRHNYLVAQKAEAFEDVHSAASD